MGRMRVIALAWKVSTLWMRMVAVTAVFLVIYALASMTSEEKAMPVAKVAVAERPDTRARDINKRAINNCWGAIEGISTNPSSVNFHSFTAPPSVEVMTNGRLQVFVKFSAKNAYGSESISIARCVMTADGSTLSEITTQASR